MTLQALYIDPELDGRLRFKQIARNSQMLANVFATNTLLEGLQRLEAKKPYDIVYLASRFSLEIIGQFISTARRTAFGSRAVFVLVLERVSCDMTTLAEFALAGVDGFLVAPFSINSLTENAVISAKILAARERRNQEVSIEVLAKAAMINFSLYAQSVKEKRTPQSARENLRRTHVLAGKLPKDLKGKYIDLLVERFSSIGAPLNTSAIVSRGGFIPSRRAARI